MVLLNDKLSHFSQRVIEYVTPKILHTYMENISCLSSILGFKVRERERGYMQHSVTTSYHCNISEIKDMCGVKHGSQMYFLLNVRQTKKKSGTSL